MDVTAHRVPRLIWLYNRNLCPSSCAQINVYTLGQRWCQQVWSWEHRKCSGLMPVCPGQIKAQPADPCVYQAPSSTHLGRQQRAAPPGCLPRRSCGCGARRSPILWKTPPPTAKPTHTPRARVRDVTEAATRYTGSPLYPTAPPHCRPGQPATKERTGGGRGSSHQPRSRPSTESRSKGGGDRWERAALGGAGAGPGGKSESEVGARGRGLAEAAGAGEEGRPQPDPAVPVDEGRWPCAQEAIYELPKLQRKPTPAPNQIKCFRGWCLRLCRERRCASTDVSLRPSVVLCTCLTKQMVSLRALDLPGFLTRGPRSPHPRIEAFFSELSLPGRHGPAQNVPKINNQRTAFLNKLMQTHLKSLLQYLLHPLLFFLFFNLRELYFIVF